MLVLIIAVYCVIAFASWILSIKMAKKVGYIDYDDLLCLAFLFGLLWPIGWPMYIWQDSRMSDIILDWVNK